MFPKCCVSLLIALPFCLGCDNANQETASKPIVEFENSIGMQFVHIPHGEIFMGSDDTRNAELGGTRSPRHKVRITKPFYIGKFAVTHEQYRALTGPYWTVPPYFHEEGAGGNPDKSENTSYGSHPADNVCWNAAQAYCEKLSDLPEEKAAGRKYRLPTEAEWEYACRAGTDSAYYFGEDIALSDANFNAFSSDSSGMRPVGATTPVGSYMPNAFGLYDMHGNVWEWCFGDLGPYSLGTKTDPAGQHAIHRVIRGGAWDFPKEYCRSDFRTEAITGYVFVGFRIVCEIEPNESL